MARTIRDTRLETRAARDRLPVRAEPYWRTIDRGAHLGYYKGKRTGSWFARFRSAESGYVKTRLGVADDARDADDAAVLTFSQAQEAAREWFKKEARKAAGIEDEDASTYTVAAVMTDYLEYYAAHRKQSGLEFTRYAVNAFILPELKDVEVAKLSPRRIRTWHEKLAAAPARLRSTKGKETRHKASPEDADGKRARRATANRILTILKASLNRAYHDGMVPTDEAWRRVKPFRGTDHPRVRYLNEAECTRLVNASSPAFRPLVQAALLTGCRYGELIAMRCDDFHADSGTVLVREAKGGKARNAVLSEEGQQFFGRVTVGQPGSKPMFVKADGSAWQRGHQRRALAQACATASIDPPATFHTLRHTVGAQLAMRGVPLQVIAAQLGHADTRVCEKHYAHLAPSYVADTIRANMPLLGVVESDAVTPLRQRR